MGFLHSCAYLIFPSFLQTSMMHEESWVGLNPAFSVKAEATAGDDQMDVRMPFHVGTKSVDDNQYAHTHFCMSRAHCCTDSAAARVIRLSPAFRFIMITMRNCHGIAIIK